MIYLIINLATSNRIYHIKDFVIILAFWEYFRLSTSTWMGVEAFNIYKRAFQNGSPKHFLIRASVSAWGESLLILVLRFVREQSPEAYSKSSHTSNIGLFAKTVKSLKPLSVFKKVSMSDVSQAFGCNPELIEDDLS